MPASSSGSSTTDARDASASRARRAVIAALVLPAIIVVTLAARSYRPFEGAQTRQRAASTTVIDSLYTLALFGIGIAVVLVVWVGLQVRRQPGARRPRRSSLWGSLVYFLVVTIVVVIARSLLHIDTFGRRGGNGDAALIPQVRTPRQRPLPTQEVSGRAPQIVWPLVVVLGVLAAAAAIAAVIVVRRRSAARTAEEALEELRAALDHAIDDLRREPDPRRAVEAAYARMEEALGAYGLPRRSSEAPYEYLRRAAHDIQADEPMAELTDLFELAKFSEHAVGEPMRERAIASLVAVRNEAGVVT
jgi:membrane protease YdiL (CAAX protease family)